VYGNAELTPTKPISMSLAHEVLFPCRLRPRFGAESATPLMAIDNTATDIGREISLNGTWAVFFDPYLNGLFGFPGQEESHGLFINEKAMPGNMG
jgi:hypothetical protein